MKLFHLWVIDESTPTYDIYNSFVIRAKDKTEARQIAAKRPGDEGEATWLDPSRSACEVLTSRGLSGIVCADFNAG